MRAMTTVSAALPDDAPHLLVVDDDRRIRDLLSRFLFAEGYRVTTAETAADARAKLAGLRFDLLILDVMMPGETGFDLARALRASSSVPIIMLTARDEAQSRIEGLTIGADDYVSKPFEPRELSLRIASILRRARPAAAPPVESVRFGDFRFHLARGELKRGEEIVRLPARRCRGRRSPATTVRPASAPSTCKSTACAARSSTIRPIRCWCRPCAASATGW
jgi:two-component system, OmpR family, phosphate regulon response regulator OmpR